MKKFNFFWVGFLIFFSVTCFADYKDERIKKPPVCLFQCILQDGFYLGVSAGYDIYSMNLDSALNSNFFDDEFAFSANPVLNAGGIVGGAYFGYGRDFPYFHHTYLGIEAFGYGSASSSNYQLLTNDSSYEIDIEGKNNFGLSIIPGIKFVSSTLMYIKLGYIASKINVTETFQNNDPVPEELNENPMVYGWNVGLGIENAFFDDFSIRAEYSYQWFNSFDTAGGTKVTPRNGEFLLGLSYRIIL